MPDLFDHVDRRRLVDRFGPMTNAWCDALPALVADLSVRWGLDVAAPLPAGSNSIVLSCGDVVLKLTPDPRIAAEEVAALRAWSGRRYVVQLVDADVDRGAVLLEAVRPGVPLSSDPRGWSLAEIAPLLIELGDVPAPVGVFGSLADRVQYVFDLFEARLRRRPDVAARIDPEVVTRSRAAAASLAGTGDVGLLHGDLHPGNVLRGMAGVVAIDPRPCIGDRACDAVDWALADIIDDDGLDRRITDLVTLVPTLDAVRVRAWCEAFAVIVAASMLHRQADDRVGKFALQLAVASAT